MTSLSVVVGLTANTSTVFPLQQEPLEVYCAFRTRISSPFLILLFFQADRVARWSAILPELQTDLLCFLVGDFNEILLPTERLNCSSYSTGMIQFGDFIQASNLIEVNLQGHLFTWNNNHSRSKIDRCFLSANAFILWLNLSLSTLGPKPFKSINAWWSNSSFHEFVANSWRDISASPGIDGLASKLRLLRQLIKTWNVNCFGNLNTRYEETQTSIDNLETSADSRPLSDQEVAELMSLRGELNSVSKQQKSLWYQKSRLNWNFFGDRNSKFFHTVASVHSSNNLVSEIVVENQRFTTPETIKLNVHLYYKDLFKSPVKIDFSLDSLPIQRLTVEQAASLSAQFSEEEIFLTLLGCEYNKAPGPDGFNYFFYKKAWKIIKHDILELFNNFHHTGAFPADLNTAFLVLIPNRKGATDIKDFWPISLINGVFKLLSKVLANRLSPLLPLLISENQFVFIKGRNIHDCHMLASDLIHLVHIRKESSSQLSVLVNGSPSKNSTMHRGVRQGDPIFPMFFVLAVEGLKALFEKAIDLGLLDGIHVDGYAVPISILQFADDTHLFVPKDLKMISSIIGINVDDNSLDEASRILNCKIEKLSITYLGLPLSLKPVKAKKWDPVIRTFLLNERVVLSLERLMRRFLWNESVSSAWFSKVSWIDVCLPFTEGGLNITPLRTKNQSLLLEWIWKLITADKNSFWFLVISCSSGFKNWFDLEEIAAQRLSHLWKGIVSVCFKNSQVRDLFLSHLGSRICSGSNTRFWHDSWADASALLHLFPDLFQLSRGPQLSQRGLRLGEQEQFQSLHNLISDRTPSSSGTTDVFNWQGKSFSSAAFNSAWFNASRHQVSCYGRFWKFKLPPRINFFMWLLARDRISSNIMLIHRGVSLINASCTFCSEDETSIHIILHCRFAWHTWNPVLKRCNITWSAPNSIHQFFDFWSSLCNRRFRYLWQTIWFFFIWELWKVRNKRVFSQDYMDNDTLVYQTICKAVIFYKDNNKGFDYSANDVYRNLSFFCNFL
ncbi:uncharacterized protein LOC126660308 [Mercurialis annua]|uniref:uncharacterized protein LOC126660308 n=1 Tax=Mercurialis annua TaxID=3986 RepID=UPI00215E7F66|nr:uncharacterized protein LOC126660308 [Mercurialis annua]